MVTRVKKALDKLIFCLRISGNANTFFTLLRETKRLRWAAGSTAPHENPHTYRLNIAGTFTSIFLRTYAGDITMLYEIFLNRSYQFKGMETFTPKTIVDLGAHIGMSALYFSTCFTGAEVYCIEPDEDNFTLLQKNTVSNRQITPIRAAISDTDGTAGIEKSRFSYNSSIQAGEGNNSIRTVTMPTLLNQLNITTIDLLKVDIEGYEKKIFAGNISWLAKVNRIIIEVHSPEDEAVTMAALKQYHFIVGKLVNAAMADSIYYGVRDIGH
jgi:FkbM family methyltransferase